MSVAERLGVPVEHVENVGMLKGGVLPSSQLLFNEAFGMVRSCAQGTAYGRDPGDTSADPKLLEAQMLLAAAILDKAQSTSEGRLSAALSMIAQLVAKANPSKTLGPEGAELRSHLIPSGWMEMSSSWEKTRYAWREGMESLLDAGENPSSRAVVQALNEVTRLSPSEPEPVKVNIQESFPSPKIAFAITAIGIGLSLRSFTKEWKSKK